MDRFSSSTCRAAPLPAAPRGNATPMSEVRASGGPARARTRALARTSLVLGVTAMSTAACVITSAPQFNAQQHTRPFLDPTTALPDPREVVIVDEVNLMLHPNTPITFSADVISQDDAAGSTGAFQMVDSFLYIDYGIVSDTGQPFAWAIEGSEINPGTIDQTNRSVSAPWFPDHEMVGYGCHTATLVASHLFDRGSGPASACPVCGDDYTFITWLVNRCDSTTTGVNDCDALSTECPAVVSSCAMVQPTDPSATSCPDAPDAGVQ